MTSYSTAIVTLNTKPCHKISIFTMLFPFQCLYQHQLPLLDKLPPKHPPQVRIKITSCAGPSSGKVTSLDYNIVISDLLH